MEQFELERSVVDPVAFANRVFSWNAHPCQELVMRDPAKVKVVAAGRRFGKSEMIAVDFIFRAVTEPGCIQYVVSHSQDQANIIFNTIYALIIRSPLKPMIARATWGGVKNAFPTLELSNGSVIFAQSASYNGKYLRGHKAHRIVIDEAAQMNKSILPEVILPMLLDYDGDLVLISTPLGRNWFYDEWIRGRGDGNQIAGYKSFRFRTKDNPHISQDAIDRLTASMTENQRQCEIEAEFIDDLSFYFKWERLQAITDDYNPKNFPEVGRMYCMGVDLAKDVDYTIIVVLDITDPNAVTVAHFERFNHKSYEYVLERIADVGLSYAPSKIWIDQTGVGNPIVDRLLPVLPQLEGFSFSNTPGNPKKYNLLQQLKLGIEQRRLRLPASEKSLQDELHYFEFLIDKDTNMMKLHAASGHHDDTVIALALAWQHVAVPIGPVNVFGVEAGKGAEKAPEEWSLMTVTQKSGLSWADTDRHIQEWSEAHDDVFGRRY